MIYDKLENAARYEGLHAGIAKALGVLPAYIDKALGRYEIDGKDLFVLVQGYDTKPLSAAVWETHKQYADVQYVVSGNERMGITDTGTLTVLSPYEADRDAALYVNGGEGALLPCPAGVFVVFYPDEAHMPCVADGGPSPVRKLVAKVRMA